ncbi:TetR/AcrR family transcriptional regulator [Zavarzinia sp.]|uniref:TetR/AcrR family transcriptional regulator n=1 Tax=Zavarzinia sp. TaxID=2027920 RepID=UPI003BB4AE24
MSRIDARDAILASALRLFGERGFDGVATTEILEGAGQRNQTALQYHFGSREGLYRAIVVERLKAIDARRLAILDPGATGSARPDLPTCLRALVQPLLEQALQGQGGADHVLFLRQYCARPGFSLGTVAQSLALPGMSLMIVALARHAPPPPGCPPDLAASLMLQVTTTMLAAWLQDGGATFAADAFQAAAIESCRAIRRGLLAQAKAGAS